MIILTFILLHSIYGLKYIHCLCKSIFLFVHFLCLHKETNQQRSGEESAADHSPLRYWSRILRDYPALLLKRGRFGKSLKRSAEPLSSLYSVARLREMALQKTLFF